MPHRPGLGAIYGIVAENGVPKVASPIHLLDRSSPKVLRTVQSADDGGFSFSGLNTETDDYMVVATDETGSDDVDASGNPVNPYKNALVQDRVTPVPVHIGSYYPSAWWSKVASMSPPIVFPGAYYDDRFDMIALASSSLGSGVAAPQGTGTWSVSDLSPFADGAFNLPVATLTNDVWIKLYTQQPTTVVGVGSYFTMMVVADFGHSWGVTQRYFGDVTTPGSDYSLRMTIPLCHLSFDGIDTLKFEVDIHHYDSGGGSDQNVWSGSVGKTYTQTITPPPVWGTVALVFRSGTSCVLYVDNTEYILDESTVPQQLNTYSTANQYLADAALHEGTRIGDGMGSRFAFYMFTPQAVEASRLADLRDALINGGLPTETGYARAITVDLPSLFYRLDEFNTSTGYVSEHYEGDVSLIPSATYYHTDIFKELRIGGPSLYTTGPSPVAGRSSMVLDGNQVLFNSYHGALPNNRNFSISFWMKQTNRDAQQTIINTASRPWTTDVKNYYVRANTDGTLVLYLAGVEETFTSTTIFALDTWYHIVFVIHKEEEMLRLYSNGVLTDSLPVTASNVHAYDGFRTNTYRYASDFDYFNNVLTIGGLWGGSSVSQGFIGALADVALFSAPLSAARIADHYANKDVI